MKNIIGICGLIGSGKDTVADYLVENYQYKRLSFATVLKDACADIFQWDREMLEGKTAAARSQRESPDAWWENRLQIPNFSPRYALQYVGTDLFRNILHSDIWVYALERNLFKHKDIVISDVRFPNEINMLRSNKAKIWHIYRGDIPDWFQDTKQLHHSHDEATAEKIIKTKYPNLHQSEWAWSGTNFDLSINNNFSLIDLHNIIEATVKS